MMMKMNKYLFVAALSLALYSCAKEEMYTPENETAAPSETTVLTVNLPSDTTKTGTVYKDSKYKVVWKTGDVITVNGKESEPLAAIYNNSTSALFVFNDVIESPYNVLYGGKDANTITVPAIQTYTEGSICSGSAPMYASSDDLGSITLHNINAIFKLSYTSTSGTTLKKILVGSAGTEQVSGDFTMSKDSENMFNGEMKAAGGTAFTSLDLGSGVTIGSTPTDFYIALPAGTYADGIKVYVVDNTGKAMPLSFGTASGITLSAQNVYQFTAREYSPKNDLYVIYDNATLDAFRVAASVADNTSSAILINDITRSSKWTNITGSMWKGGVFDGCGHTIKGLTGPFSGRVDGVTFKNLTIDADISVSWQFCALFCSSSGTGTTFINCKTKGSLNHAYSNATSTYYCGAFVGCAYGSENFINCVNEATITLPSAVNTSGAVAAGGILGYSAQPVTIQGCTNKGAIVCNATASGELNIGGVFGWLNTTAGKVSYCHNSGSVTAGDPSAPTAATGMVGVGGIAGRIAGVSASGNAHHLTNSGNIQNNTTSTSINRTGGIVAYGSNGTYSSFHYCENSGNVETSDKVSAEGNICCGGCFGSAANNISYCKNSGSVTNNGQTTKSSTYHYTGGILGIDNSAAAGLTSYCENSGSVTSGASSAGYSGLYIAGITGYNYNPVANCQNSGTVCAGGTVTSGEVLVGGICSRSRSGSVATITNCSNNAIITIDAGLSSSGIVYVGGVVGNPNGPDVSGLSAGKDSEVLIPAANLKKDLYAGGVIGLSNSNTSDITFEGKVTIGAVKTPTLRCGGITGRLSKASATFSNLKSESSSSITVDCQNATGSYIGGVAGMINVLHTLEDSYNKGNISVTPGAKYVETGGITGRLYSDKASGAIVWDNVSNYGDITVNGAVTYTSGAWNSYTGRNNTGGLFGNTVFNKSGSTISLALTNCSNSGDISFPTAAGSQKLSIGGIGAWVSASVFTETGTVNSGNISVIGNVDSLSIGGHYGLISRDEPMSATITGTPGTATNSGKIYLQDGTGTDGTTSSTAPVAGGIVGQIIGKADKKQTVIITSCSNTGAVDRRTYSAANGVPSTDDYYSAAGGILGWSGSYGSGDAKFCNVKLRIENCSNSANIKFNRFRGTDGTYNPGDNNYTACYSGGIAGFMRSAISFDDDGGCEIKSCTNSGNILSNAGRNGGIAGMLMPNSRITGTGSSYTVNSGRVMHFGANLSWSAPSKVQGYAGGIAGYIGGYSNISIEYCSVTETCWTAGNYGVGSILGGIAAGNSTSPIIRYCKVKGTNRASSKTTDNMQNSFKGGSGLVVGWPNKEAVTKGISDIAVASSIFNVSPGGSDYSLKTASQLYDSDLFYKAISVRGYAITEAYATANNIYLWDGTTAPSWE